MRKAARIVGVVVAITMTWLLYFCLMLDPGSSWKLPAIIASGMTILMIGFAFAAFCWNYEPKEKPQHKAGA